MVASSMAWGLLRVQRRTFSSTAKRLQTYGFIGLGQMGYQMAKNLQSKLPPSDSIQLFDINKDAMRRLSDEMQESQAGGATVRLAESVNKAAKEADTVITVLPEPQHVKGVYAELLSPDLPKKSRIYIDCSTIDPSSSRDVSKLVASAGQGQFVDAPMSGGVVGAKAGTLTFMLGSPDELVPIIEPILLRMGKRVLHCGAQGTGLSAKLANNYLLAINNIATAEAMNLGIRWGLEPKTLAGVINVSTGRCWPSEVNNPVKGVVENAPASRDYAGGFGISLMKKDLKLAIVAAEEAKARLELGSRAKEVYEEAEKVELWALASYLGHDNLRSAKQVNSGYSISIEARSRRLAISPGGTAGALVFLAGHSERGRYSPFVSSLSEVPAARRRLLACLYCAEIAMFINSSRAGDSTGENWAGFCGRMFVDMGATPEAEISIPPWKGTMGAEGGSAMPWHI
ncbi:hypothetical protein DL766_003513 [Monosporascus sp. MC13-8B]|uniref:3-hydroxyisobutyrate dehydrogenase n=1 Tax=Monosporascus cannonballus TaxID=155416 RepID=A0ABY0HKX2_9PEZI|nr:hypothetical protein DL763_005179 [Monosporascus cannonballus]RYO95490.1 hypothetical protein DL762_000052 [Monosporascus cannonballus]RYP33351.1 hypothetical protein DL766_003513 [Monosporascus sp. MC13-8B]